METSRDKYYTEMFKNLTDYSDRNNTPLFNTKIQEEIHKVIEEEPIAEANNFTVDTFSHASNTKRNNTNTIFTSEKLDKPGELVDSVKNLIINSI